MRNDRKTLQLTTVISMHVVSFPLFYFVAHVEMHFSRNLMQIYFIFHAKCSYIYYLSDFSHTYHDDNNFFFYFRLLLCSIFAEELPKSPFNISPSCYIECSAHKICGPSTKYANGLRFNELVMLELAVF